MHYLSVHDLVWINTTVTGKTQPFNYETLEQAMAAQYSYGVSTDVAGQAANLLQTFLAGKPFARGNLRTAYIATVTFLQANGFDLTADDERAAQITRDVAARPASARDAILALAAPGSSTLRPGVTLRALVTHICNEHADVLKRLTEGDE